MAYIASRSLEESGRVDKDILGKMGIRKGMGRLKIKYVIISVVMPSTAKQGAMGDSRLRHRCRHL